MGCCLCRRKRKGTDDADGGDGRVNKGDGENARKEEVLYATIDHGNSKGTEKLGEMEDSCDYAMVNIPSTPAQQPSEAEDPTDEYVFMS